MEVLTAFAIGLTFAVGIFQILRRNVIRAAIGLMLLTNAVNLFLLSTGAYTGVKAPYVGLAGVQADALPQALILTSIVIGLGLVALMTALGLRIYEKYGTFDLSKIRQLRG